MSKPNDVYWAERFQLLEAIQNEDGRNVIRKLKKAYDQATKDLEKDLAYWYARFADNEGISLADARKMLTKSQLRDFKMTVEEYISKGESLDPKWRDALERASIKVHVSRLEALKLQLQQHAEETASRMALLMDEYATSSYKKQYYHTAFEIQKGIGLGWDLQKLDDRQVSKVVRKPWAADGTNFSERVWDNRTKLVNELHTTLTSSIARGENPTKTINKLADKMDNSLFNAGRVVMTEGAFFASAAKQDCFADLDVEWFEIVATLDFKTSQICRDMDGKVFERKDYTIGSTAPPFHPWCRTCVSPYFADTQDAVRVARNAEGEVYEVPANMSYSEWEQSFIDGGDKKDLTPSEPEQAQPKVQPLSTNDEFDALRTKFYATTNLEERDKILQDAGALFKDKLTEAGFFNIDETLQAEYLELYTAANKFFTEHTHPRKGDWDDPANHEIYRQMWRKVEQFRADYSYRVANAAKAVLSKYRRLGFGDLKQTDLLKAGRIQERKRVVEALDCYPQDWLRALSKKGPFEVIKIDRGYFDEANKVIAINEKTSQGYAYTVAIHELGHGFEHSIQSLRMCEAQFYDRRTQGCAREKLKDLFPMAGYEDWEATYKDDFISPYMGKDYDGRAFELVSMGFQYLFTEPKKLAQDEDMLKFILGLLVLIDGDQL